MVVICPLTLPILNILPAAKVDILIYSDCMNINGFSSLRSDPRQIFKPMPDPVVFTDYEIGKIYEVMYARVYLFSNRAISRFVNPGGGTPITLCTSCSSIAFTSYPYLWQDFSNYPPFSDSLRKYHPLCGTFIDILEIVIL